MVVRPRHDATVAPTKTSPNNAARPTQRSGLCGGCADSVCIGLCTVWVDDVDGASSRLKDGLPKRKPAFDGHREVLGVRESLAKRHLPLLNPLLPASSPSAVSRTEASLVIDLRVTECNPADTMLVEAMLASPPRLKLELMLPQE